MVQDERFPHFLTIDFTLQPSGFNDFNAALADDGLDNDEDVAKAISTSYGKRPIKVWN